MGNVKVRKNKEGYELDLNAMIYSELLMSNVRFLVTNQICRDEETTREILTKEEINLLMETPITRKYMGLVRDLYLFCCFIGLAFIDLYNLKEENIKTFLTMASGLLSTDRRQERKPTSSCLTIPSR